MELKIDLVFSCSNKHYLLMSLNEIIFDHIDDRYAYGKYSDFTVIIMKENRYINATKLCKEYGKELYHWSENKCNKKLIEEVEKEISSPDIPGDENKAFILIKGGRNELVRGTYVHELLIPHIASWISLNKKSKIFLFNNMLKFLFCKIKI
jgi:hypothetical protein